MQGDEDGIYSAVGSTGPVSIAFHVSAGFQLYKKGVYSRWDKYSTRQSTSWEMGGFK